MKKLLLLFISLGFLSTASQAQIGLGLRGGFGGSTSSQELVNGMTREFGYAPVYGFMFNYDLDLHFAAGFEANYTTYSEIITYSKAFHPGPGEDNRVAVTSSSIINYLQVPIFGRITFGEKKNKLFASFGPYFGIGLSGKRQNTMPREGITNKLTSSYDAEFKAGDFNRLDIGGQIGAGLQRLVGKSGYLFLEARFQIGFLDFYNDLTPDQRASYLGSNAQGYGYFVPGGAWRAANITIGYFHTFKLPKKNASSGGVKKAGKQKR